jgi:hypothetical protein
MRLQTPTAIQNVFYLGLDTRATKCPGDELLGFSLGRLYVGIYPTATGFDISCGILDDKGCL